MLADEGPSFAPAEVVESSRNRILGCRGKGLLREVQAAEEGLEAGLASLPAPLNLQRRELFLRLLLQDKEPAQ